LKRHPIHLMLVHFPAALLPADLFFMAASVYLENESLAQAAYYCLLAGVLGGWIAFLTGFYDLFTYLLQTQSQGIKKGFIHAGIQTTVILRNACVNDVCWELSGS